MSTSRELLPRSEPRALGLRRLSRLLVAYDGSGGANAAAGFGLWLAAKAGCRTTLVHAVPDDHAVASADLLPAFADQAAAYQTAWRRRLENLRDYAADNAAVDWRLVPDTPAGALIAAASETAADLVLAGSHGAGRMRGALIGSVSSQLLTHAPCSVMLFREDASASPAAQARTVVVGIDGSPSSRYALELAQSLAVPLGAALVLLHAYDEHVPYVSEPTEALRAEMRRHATAIVHDARATVAAPLDVVREEIVTGPARRALVAACQTHAPALLVVGSRGLGGFRELLLGGTSRWVANCAPCPVVVARDGHPHRWHVHIEGRSRPVIVELAREDRQELELTDEEIHALLPTALQRRVAEEPEAHDVPWDTPVRLLQTHFVG